MQPLNPLSPLPPLAAGAEAVAPAADAAYQARATRAALQFEGFFIAQMLHQMRAGARAMAGEDSVFKDPVNSDMLDMADDMLADKMAGQRAFGVADAILRQLLPPQPGQIQPAPAAASQSGQAMPQAAPLNRGA